MNADWPAIAALGVLVLGALFALMLYDVWRLK